MVTLPRPATTFFVEPVKKSSNDERRGRHNLPFRPTPPCTTLTRAARVERIVDLLTQAQAPTPTSSG
jgi:hypothetical protein